MFKELREFKNYNFYFFILFIFSLTPLNKIFFAEKYSYYIIYDNISFENVVFYISKSHSLIKNFSFFYFESVNSHKLFFAHDLLSNFITSLFLIVVQSYSDIFINIFFTFITSVYLFYLLITKINFSKPQSLFVTTITLFFLGIGPDSFITIKNIILFKDLHPMLLFRLYSPQLVLIFFLIYFYIIDRAFRDFSIKNLFIISLLNSVVYFYLGLITVLSNSLFSFFLLKKRKVRAATLLMSLNVAVLLMYFYLSFIFKDFVKATDMGINLNIFQIDFKNLINYFRNNIVSLFFIIILYFFNTKKLSKPLLRLFFVHLVFQLLTVSEFFIKGLHISMHIGMYFYRPLNWVTLFFILFKFNFFNEKNKNYNLIFCFLTILLSHIHQFYYHKQVIFNNKNNIYNQKLILSDLKIVNDSHLIANSNKNLIFIEDPYVNMVFSSIVSLKPYDDFKISIDNSGVFRNYSISIDRTISTFVKYCYFFNLNLNQCYGDFMHNNITQYFNNSFIFTGIRDYSFYNFQKNFLNFSKPLDLERNTAKKNTIFILSRSNIYHKQKIELIKDLGLTILYLSELVVVY
jgi:hypothetical protein